jgi:hypothetical protein
MNPIPAKAGALRRLLAHLATARFAGARVWTRDEIYD